MKTTLILIISFLVVTTASIAQIPLANKGSMQQMKSVFNKFSSDYLPVANQNIYFKYSVNTEYKEVKGKKMTDQLTIVEVIAGGNKSIVKTPQLEIYNNGKYTVSVDNVGKNIFLSYNVKPKSEKTYPELIKFLEDTLFSMSKVEKNELFKSKGYEIRLIRLRLNSSGAKMFGIATVDFYIDDKSQEIKRMKIYYYNNESLKSIEYTFLKRNQDYKTDVFKQDFASMFLNGKGQPREAYKNYELNDYRKNS